MSLETIDHSAIERLIPHRVDQCGIKFWLIPHANTPIPHCVVYSTYRQFIPHTSLFIPHLLYSTLFFVYSTSSPRFIPHIPRWTIPHLTSLFHWPRGGRVYSTVVHTYSTWIHGLCGIKEIGRSVVLDVVSILHLFHIGHGFMCNKYGRLWNKPFRRENYAGKWQTSWHHISGTCWPIYVKFNSLVVVDGCT